VNPITHALVGWSTASLDRSASNRERGLVVLAALAPDVDGAGIVAELATRHTESPLLWWSQFHHTLAHNLLFAILVATAGWLLSRSLPVTVLMFVNVHLHLLGDLVGARGPDGSQWPIPYLWPFSELPLLTVSWQWALNAWPNILLSLLLLGHLFWLAWARGISPLQLFSSSANRAFVATLRRRVSLRSRS
jgi:hypothetical protein